MLLQIEDLQVISFDRFMLKRSMMIEQDETVQMHIGFVSHFLGKKSLIEESKESMLLPISKNLFTDEGLLTSHKQNNNFKVPNAKNMPFL